MTNTLALIWKNCLVHVIDILVVGYIIYRLLLLLKGTRAIQILSGIAILGIITIISRNVIGLKTLSWLLENFWLPGVIVIAIVFQPELRNLFIQLGTAKLARDKTKEIKHIPEVLSAIKEMSEKRIGGLFVFVKNIGLKEFIETGVIINSDIKKELILSIFHPGSALHDGAVIIEKGRTISAGVTLPLTENEIYKRLGTRHKAAIGITEITDATAVVVSEEIGDISIAKNGKLEKINIDILKEKLHDLLVS